MNTRPGSICCPARYFGKFGFELSVTLRYAARDERHNNAFAPKQWLERSRQIVSRWSDHVIASAAKQFRAAREVGLLRRYAPRNDEINHNI
jgi:hypothetical protein